MLLKFNRKVLNLHSVNTYWHLIPNPVSPGLKVIPCSGTITKHEAMLELSFNKHISCYVCTTFMYHKLFLSSGLKNWIFFQAQTILSVFMYWTFFPLCSNAISIIYRYCRCQEFHFFAVGIVKDPVLEEKKSNKSIL